MENIHTCKTESISILSLLFSDPGNPSSSSFQSLNCVWLFVTHVWLMFIESVMPSNHLVLCRPLLLLSSIFPSISVFSKESGHCTRWPKHWRFSFGISTSNEYSGLISFRIDWFDFLAVQGTLKSLFQHYSSKASVSALNFLYSPTLTSIHDYWKDYSFDYIDLCQQSNCLCFLICCLGLS